MSARSAARRCRRSPHLERGCCYGGDGQALHCMRICGGRTDRAHHEGTLVAGKEATCTEDGSKEYYTCACGKFFEDEDCTIEIADLDSWKVIPKKGHSWSDDYLKENADAEKHYHVCAECGTKDAGEAHTWNVDAATEETDRHCTVCGYVAEEQIGHVHEGTLVAGKEATWHGRWQQGILYLCLRKVL